MTRLALALAAILVLTLSAGLSHTQLAPPSASEGDSLRVLQAQQVVSTEFDFAQVGRQPQAPTLHSGEDAPEPALIAYLALVLIGSVVGVGMVRHNARSQG